VTEAVVVGQSVFEPGCSLDEEVHSLALLNLLALLSLSLSLSLERERQRYRERDRERERDEEVLNFLALLNLLALPAQEYKH
jgi:hypothetical protein